MNGWINHYEEYLVSESQFKDNPLVKKNMPKKEANKHKNDC
jgi:hypothetical protein